MILWGRMWMTDPLARPEERQARWHFQTKRNDDIRRRIRAGQTGEQVSRHYGLSVQAVERIATLGGLSR